MDVGRALSSEVATALLRTVDTYRAVVPARHLGLVKRICLQSAMFGQTWGEQPGMRARSSAQLLLELACPQLDASIRDELALACEYAAIGLAVPQRGA